ncbi:MAG TPA: hypothetical protein VMH80_03965 [Bryobacteraceae bacterium]|nr:hypothetical protein [Bryobacteraceae bacterium]
MRATASSYLWGNIGILSPACAVPAVPTSIYNRIGMGLEVRVYAGLVKAHGVETDVNGYPKDLRRYWLADVVESTEEDFPGRTGGLEQGAIYAYAHYEEFHAGSTRAYGQWRHTLARLAGYEGWRAVWRRPPPPPSPFVELIRFHDCAGVLGPVVAAKLARDFAAFRERAERIGGTFFGLYEVWQRACELTAGNGALRFTGVMNEDQSCRECGLTDVELWQWTGPLKTMPYWMEDDLCSRCARAMYRDF